MSWSSAAVSYCFTAATLLLRPSACIAGGAIPHVQRRRGKANCEHPKPGAARPFLHPSYEHKANAMQCTRSSSNWIAQRSCRISPYLLSCKYSGMLHVSSRAVQQPPCSAQVLLPADMQQQKSKCFGCTLDAKGFEAHELRHQPILVFS